MDNKDKKVVIRNNDNTALAESLGMLKFRLSMDEDLIDKSLRRHGRSIRELYNRSNKIAAVSVVAGAILAFEVIKLYDRVKELENKLNDEELEAKVNEVL